MAGGRGLRLASPVEKPMVRIAGRPMLDWVAQTAVQSGCVSRLIVCASPNTPLTAKHARIRGLEVFVASGRGYVEDMVEAIKTLRLGITLVLPSDTPLVKPSTLNSLLHEYRTRGVDVLTMCVEKSSLMAMGIRPEHSLNVGGREFCPMGISVVDGRKLSASVELKEDYYVWRDTMELLNVNTQSELHMARTLFESVGGRV
ncbi:MAG: NTP transferase domain-containing protein [Thermoprotei archaeon]